MRRTIHVAHSPDSDDAFMFYALAEGKLNTGDLHYAHELADIESLNQRARRKELEVTAVSIHAYAYLWRDYALLNSGSSMGDGYGPRLVSSLPVPQDPRAALKGRRSINLVASSRWCRSTASRRQYKGEISRSGYSSTRAS
jgi:1,4-dihydroxy-6-naphthoate synthase